MIKVIHKEKKELINCPLGTCFYEDGDLNILVSKTVEGEFNHDRVLCIDLANAIEASYYYDKEVTPVNIEVKVL